VRVEPDLPQQRLRAPVTRALLLLLVLGGAEPLVGRYRAVTLEPGQRRTFRVTGLETVTGSTGRCVEESIDEEEADALALQASCGGVRTTLAWKKGGERVHIMACAEAEDRQPALVSFRKTVQAQLKGSKTVTACVRNGRVELWGWASSEDELKHMGALEKKYGMDRVRSFVELLEPET
jgi:hypothetical protein